MRPVIGTSGAVLFVFSKVRANAFVLRLIADRTIIIFQQNKQADSFSSI